MALSYGFFDAELTPSGQYDRAYAAEQFAEYFHLIVSNGVFPDPATQLQVVASDTPNMNVNVSDGYGWINGYYAKNSGPYPLAIQAASGTLNRIDAVVLRWVNASRSMELAVKTGIAASAPASPALQRDTDVYELMLATVTVAAGATSIPQSSITDKRSDTAVCGWITGAVQNIDTTNLFAQYDTAFQEWFDNIKSQLSGDIATNLQNQIDRNAANIATINATTLKEDTKTALGLPISAGPDDAFKVLANVGNLHVWERVQDGVTDYLTSTDRNAYPDNVTDAQDAYYSLGDVVSGSFYMGIPANPYQNTYTYSSSLSVSDDGTVSLANPSTATSSQWSPLSTDDINSTLVGKFVQWTCQDPNNLDTKYPFNASPSPIIFIPSDAKITVTTPDVTERFTLSKYQPVTGHAAIPANTTITYLGQLGGGARIEVGSYVGTGTYGQSNPNSLTFGFEPKMVVIVPKTQYSAYMLALVRGVSKVTSWWYGNNSDLAFVTWADNFVSWYSTGNERQLNLSGETYDYIAIG